MDRRTFLKIAALFLSSQALSACRTPAPETAPAVSPAGKSNPVLVIGAGMAGLAAARTLRQSGQAVLILEGRDRIGGRLWTSTRWDDAPMDLGASWIHGVEGNPITTLAREANARLATTSYDRTLIHDSDGRPLGAARERELERLREQLERALRAAQRADRDQSVQAAAETLAGWGELSAESRQLVDFLLNSTIEQEYAGSTSELSAHWYDEGKTFDGDDQLFPDGYQTVVRHLAQGVAIQTGQVVREIAWRAGKVTVTTDTTRHEGAAAVITLPLGVLKAGSVTFDPALPDRKQQAIRALGMGLLNKCYLRFPSVFQDPAYDWLEYIPPRKGEWVEWVSLARLTGKPILLGFSAADFAREMEGWTDRQIVASAMQTLRTMFGAGIPESADYQITRWAADPFALGSYSFNALGATPKMRDDLAAGVDNTLFFAGEAASRHYPGTVHGAWLSGVRAAEALLAAIDK
jgi:monoamine oxidase